MATIAEYFSQQPFAKSNTPRASMNIVDASKGIQAEVLASVGNKLASQLASIEAEKQFVRDRITLATMKGALEDFDFNTFPDINSVQTIEDFQKQEETYHKERGRMIQRLSSGKRQRVSDEFKIYVENNKANAKINYRNKSRPMERSWAIADLQKQYANTLKGNVNDPAAAQKQLHDLVDAYRPYLTSTEAQTFRENIDSSVESFGIHQAISGSSPADAYDLIENAKTLEQEQKNQLKSKVDGEVAKRERARKVKLQEDREDTMRTVLTNIWEGKLNDPQIVTSLTKANLLDVEDAKYLRKTILSPDPPTTTNEAYIAMMYAKDGIGLGVKSREDALKELIKWSGQLSPTDGQGFIDEIFGEHDSKNAFWNREAQAYMEKQILEVSTMSGILYGSGEQQAMSAKALLAFDQAKKNAMAKGEPLEGRDLLLKAHEVMLPFRQKPIIEGENIPGTLQNLSPQEEIRRSLGLPERTPGQAAIDAFNQVVSQRVEVEKDGKRFTVPMKELDDALMQGYKRVK